MKEFSIFLGANTCRGFGSLYDECIASLKPRRLYVVKGSAGCGKSSLMKRIADHAASLGEPVVRVLCSGDPDSLDGVILPDRGIAVFDGTAPHVLEPDLVGQQGFYIDLSRFFRSPAADLGRWTEAYREHYRKAYLLLAAAGSLEELERCPQDTVSVIRRRAASLAARTLGRAGQGGSFRRCYTDSFTCKGAISLTESRRAIAPRLIALTGGGQRADLFLQVFLQEARDRGRSVVVCPDPLDPRRIAHLLLPELGLGLTTGDGNRRIHLEKLGTQLTEAEKAEHREMERLRTALLARAASELSQAKADHDRLEEAVKPNIDFTGVTQETEALIGRIFSEV